MEPTKKHILLSFDLVCPDSDSDDDDDDGDYEELNEWLEAVT